MDFIGVTFNGKHSSNFNILRVSDGDRYQDTLVPDFEDYSEEVPGGVGSYYYGSDDRRKEFTLNFAFDSMTEQNLREVRQWLSVTKPCELIFDEYPYKTYYAKISAPPSFDTICFMEDGKRVYKGEISADMVCYFPYARCSGEKKELQYYENNGSTDDFPIKGYYCNYKEEDNYRDKFNYREKLEDYKENIYVRSPSLDCYCILVTNVLSLNTGFTMINSNGIINFGKIGIELRLRDEESQINKFFKGSWTGSSWSKPESWGDKGKLSLVCTDDTQMYIEAYITIGEEAGTIEFKIDSLSKLSSIFGKDDYSTHTIGISAIIYTVEIPYTRINVSKYVSSGGGPAICYVKNFKEDETLYFFGDITNFPTEEQVKTHPWETIKTITKIEASLDNPEIFRIETYDGSIFETQNYETVYLKISDINNGTGSIIIDCKTNSSFELTSFLGDFTINEWKDGSGLKLALKNNGYDTFTDQSDESVSTNLYNAGDIETDYLLSQKLTLIDKDFVPVTNYTEHTNTNWYKVKNNLPPTIDIGFMRKAETQNEDANEFLTININNKINENLDFSRYTLKFNNESSPFNSCFKDEFLRQINLIDYSKVDKNYYDISENDFTFKSRRKDIRHWDTFSNCGKIKVGKNGAKMLMIFKATVESDALPTIGSGAEGEGELSEGIRYVFHPQIKFYKNSSNSVNTLAFYDRRDSNNIYPVGAQIDKINQDACSFYFSTSIKLDEGEYEFRFKNNIYKDIITGKDTYIADKPEYLIDDPKILSYLHYNVYLFDMPVDSEETLSTGYTGDYPLYGYICIDTHRKEIYWKNQLDRKVPLHSFLSEGIYEQLPLGDSQINIKYLNNANKKNKWVSDTNIEYDYLYY